MKLITKYNKQEVEIIREQQAMVTAEEQFVLRTSGAEGHSRVILCRLEIAALGACIEEFLRGKS